jgi:3-hydroxyacyl-[acyl-carrier-protein] dehydratase
MISDGVIGVVGVPGIKQIIPHRYPILLVDRVSDIQPGKSLVAHKAITAAEPCYESADDYAYPVSLLVESWAQAAVLLACWETPNPDVLAGKVELAAGIKNVDLLEPVFPGDVLEHHVQILTNVGDAAIVAGTSFVNGRKVLEVGQFSVALRGVEVLMRPGGN